MAADTNARRVEDHRLLTESLGLITPVAHDVVAAFYQQLFLDYPQVRALFPANLQPQREKLLSAIIALVTHYDRPDQLTTALTSLGRNHIRYGTQLSHYAAVGETLMTVLRRFAGAAWNDEYEGAWQRAYTFAAGTMMMAAVQAAEVTTPTRMAA
jgi:methyl-accepting chemotaxis protein